MSEYRIQKFPKTRIATMDICSVGKQKHHIAGMIELDVTESRAKIRKYKRETGRISFTSWLVKVIGMTVSRHEQVASYLKNKHKVIIFNDINISLAVEKEINGQKVPVPLVIEKANERSIESVYDQINEARNLQITENEVVLQRKSNSGEQLYYVLPAFARKLFWKYLLRHPHYAFRKMGNVSVTSLGMMGNVNGWFVPVSVHPVCFGIGKIIKKPVFRNDKIEAREILNMTILVDHDVVDGAPMARFVNDLAENIEKGLGL